MKWIEVESYDAAFAGGHIQNCWATDQSRSAPNLAADQERSAFTISPFENDCSVIHGAIETRGAVGHAQPTSRSIVKRKILAEQCGANGIAICDGVIRSREGGAHVGSRRTRHRFHGRGSGVG